ncbi:MAG: hypothetical protein R3281_17070 [Balneolaceae bacterium]|nr:hypothetical protein [Balneolaceae bacterium]
MYRKGEDAHRYLVEKLLKLLSQLRFSEIQVKFHADYPSPEEIQTESDSRSQKYIPTLAAKKNEVSYYFELICDTSKDIFQIKNLIDTLPEPKEGWINNFVLVTEYGNREEVERFSRKADLSFDHIWEL